MSSVVDHIELALAKPCGRYRMYAGISAFFFLAAVVTRTHFFTTPANFIVSDGLGYYVYLPMILIDGEIDPIYQIQKNFPPQQSVIDVRRKTALGFVRNKYPIGFALTLAPAFIVSHWGSLALFKLTDSPLFTPNGYTVLYQLTCLAWIMGLGLLSLVWIDRLLTRFFRISPQAAAAAVGAFWFGTQYAYYYFREPFMVHVVSGFWVTATILAIARILEKENTEPQKSHLLLLGLGTGMAVVCRPTNLFIIPFLAYFVFRTRRCVWLACSLVPLLPQLVLWHQTTNHWLYYSYEEEGFHWSSPALWETLFSSRHGLFFWSPLLLLSVAGIVFGLRRSQNEERALLGCYICSAVVLWYLNSSWHQWWFGDAFGGRAFLELSSLFIIGFGFLFDWSKALSRSNRLALALVVMASLAYNWTLVALYAFNRISRSGYLF